MTRRLVAPQRRARRARRARSGEPNFDLQAIASRSAGEAGMPRRPWPGDDIAFIRAVLEANGLPTPLVKRLTAAAGDLPLTAPLIDRLSAALADQIHFAPLGETLRAPALLLLGPPGAGKTTLAAKLAAQLGEQTTLLIDTDTGKPGGSAQLAEYAEVLGLQVRAASDPASLQRMVATAGDRRVVIDTKGAVTGDTDARDVLRELITASGAAPLLAMPGDCAAVEAAAIVAFFAPLGPHALVPTRLDLVHRLGGVLAAADAARLAVPAAGVTPHFAFGLRELTPPMVARRLLAVALENEAARRPGI